MATADPGPVDARTPSYLAEHLANERTFLAWMRTSVSLIGLGVAINKFGHYLSILEAKASQQGAAMDLDSPTVGRAMVFFGILLIVGAVTRYTRVSWQIDRGTYYHSRV